MHFGMRKICKLKLRRYAERMVEINERFIFPGSKESEKIRENQLNEILLQIISNGWISQVYAQGFYFEYVTFKQVINMFDSIEIA